MIQKIAEYTVQSDATEVVMAAIVEFVAAIAEHEPRTTYEAYRRGDSFRSSTS